MDNSEPVRTPVEIGTKLVKTKDGDNLIDQEININQLLEFRFIYQQRQGQVWHMLLEMLLVSHQHQHRHIGLQSKESRDT